MKWGALLLFLLSAHFCYAGTGDEQRREAEYYVTAYA